MTNSKVSLAIILGALPAFRIQLTALNVAENHKGKLVYCLEDLMNKVTTAWYHDGAVTNTLIQSWDALKETLQDALPENEDSSDISSIFYTIESLEAGFNELQTELDLERNGLR